MLALFANNLLPVLLVSGTGYLLVRRVGLDPRPVSQLAFLVFAPCLIFQVIVDSRLPVGELGRMAAFGGLSLIALACLAALGARVLGASRARIAAVALVVLLPNAGNFGLSANRFAFGEEGLVQAGAYFIASTILTFTLGLFVASLGHSRLGEACAGLLRVPAIWGVVLGLLQVAFGWRLPIPLARPVELLADASIPCFLVLLGMQLAGRGVSGPWGLLALASASRLVGGAVLGLILAGAMGLEGTARQVAGLQSGMPSAIICIVLATEYDLEPAFVTSVVVTTTVLSPLTLTPLLALLGA